MSVCYLHHQSVCTVDNIESESAAHDSKLGPRQPQGESWQFAIRHRTLSIVEQRRDQPDPPKHQNPLHFEWLQPFSFSTSHCRATRLPLKHQAPISWYLAERGLSHSTSCNLRKGSLRAPSTNPGQTFATANPVSKPASRPSRRQEPASPCSDVPPQQLPVTNRFSGRTLNLFRKPARPNQLAVQCAPACHHLQTRIITSFERLAASSAHSHHACSHNLD